MPLRAPAAFFLPMENHLQQLVLFSDFRWLLQFSAPAVPVLRQELPACGPDRRLPTVFLLKSLSRCSETRCSETRCSETRCSETRYLPLFPLLQ